MSNEQNNDFAYQRDGRYETRATTSLGKPRVPAELRKRIAAAKKKPLTRTQALRRIAKAKALR